MNDEKLEAKIEAMEAKLNGVIGRLIVPAMQGGDPVLKEAHEMLIDFAGDFNDLINNVI